MNVVQEKLDYAQSLGADAVVNAAQTPASDAVKDITGGGAHVAIEALGFTETTINSMKSLRKFGKKKISHHLSKLSSKPWCFECSQ